MNNLLFQLSVISDSLHFDGKREPKIENIIYNKQNNIQKNMYYSYYLNLIERIYMNFV